jgi:hypothetical protein
MMRLVAVQRCPVVPKAPQRPPSMARSRLASSSTIMGFLPPSSSEQCLKLLAAVAPTILPTAEEPVSEMARTDRMLGERRADFGAEAGDDVDDAFRDAGVGQRLHQVEGGERSVLRGLDHAGVAADDGGQQLPRRDGHGEVPGRDHAADADGLADGHGEFVGEFGRHGRAEEAAAFAGVVVGGVDGFLHVAAGFFQHLAHFAGHVAGVVFFALDEDFGGAEDHFGATRSGNEAPLGIGALGGVDGGIHIGFVRALEDGDDFARVGGVAVFESLSAGGFDPFAVDEVLEDLVLVVLPPVIAGVVRVSVAMKPPGNSANNERASEGSNWQRVTYANEGNTCD